MSPLWIFLCLYKLLGSANFFPQTSQATAGFPFAPISPVLRGNSGQELVQLSNLEQLLFDLCKKETGLTYIEHNVSCVGNKKTTFRKDNGYTDIMIVKRIHLKTSIKASPRP